MMMHIVCAFALAVIISGHRPEITPEPKAVATMGSDFVVVTNPNVDPIVTGSRVTDDQKRWWRETRKRWEECPQCFNQAFPADRP